MRANATSYTFSLKDKVNFSRMHHCAYVIVPFMKQGGKVYTADAKKAFTLIPKAMVEERPMSPDTRCKRR